MNYQWVRKSLVFYCGKQYLYSHSSNIDRLWRWKNFNQEYNFLSDKIENFTSLDTLSFSTVCQPSAEDHDSLPNSTHSQNISTAHCGNSDVSCSSCSSGINVQSGASSNSTGLSSREANAISIVLGEISPLLIRYDRGVTIFKNLLDENLDASINFIDEMALTKCDCRNMVTVVLLTSTIGLISVIRY